MPSSFFLVRRILAVVLIRAQKCTAIKQQPKQLSQEVRAVPPHPLSFRPPFPSPPRLLQSPRGKMWQADEETKGGGNAKPKKLLPMRRLQRQQQLQQHPLLKVEVVSTERKSAKTTLEITTKETAVGESLCLPPPLCPHRRHPLRRNLRQVMPNAALLRLLLHNPALSTSWQSSCLRLWSR